MRAVRRSALSGIVAAERLQVSVRPRRRVVPRPGVAVRRPVSIIAVLLVAVTLLAAACAGASGEAAPAATTAPAGGADLARQADRATTTTAPPADTSPVKVLVVGDSVMVQIGQALKTWSDQHPGQIVVVNDAHLGCGTTRGGEKRYEQGTGSMGAVCATWADPVPPATLLTDPGTVSWVTWVQTWHPDVVLSYASPWDTLDRKVPSLGDHWYKPGDPPYDAYLSSEYAQALKVLSATGADVAWMTTPLIIRNSPYNDPARIERMNQLVLPLVNALPVHTVIDLAGYLGPPGGPRDKEFRDDGVHIRADHLPTLADWLAPQLVEAGAQSRRAHAAAAGVH